MKARYFVLGFVAPAFLAGLAGAGRALAADDSLYPPPPPAGSASVRVIDVRSKGGAESVSIAGQTLQATSKPSKFAYVEQGKKPFASPGYSGQATIEAGQFYSLLVGNKKSVLFHEPRPPLTQALVVLYNFSLLDGVTLKTDDGSTTVVPAQGAFRVGSQAVNPIDAGFAVYQGGRKIGSVPAVQLKRGTSFGIFVTDAPGGPRVMVAPGPALAG